MAFLEPYNGRCFNLVRFGWSQFQLVSVSVGLSCLFFDESIAIFDKIPFGFRYRLSISTMVCFGSVGGINMPPPWLFCMYASSRERIVGIGKPEWLYVCLSIRKGVPIPSYGVAAPCASRPAKASPAALFRCNPDDRICFAHLRWQRDMKVCPHRFTEATPISGATIDCYSIS